MKGIYNYQVKSQEVDFQGDLTFASIGDYLLVTAGSNADENGFGLKQLQAMDASWVLSRIAIEMRTKLKENDMFSVETWVEEVGRLATTRNFTLRNATGEVVGSACSNWVMLDMTTRRPLDLLAIKGLKEVAEQEPALMDKPARLTAISGTNIADFVVKYSDIDINGHVNSVCYIRWLCDLFSLDVYKEKRIKRLEMNYVNESLWGEKMQFFQEEKSPDDFHFEIKRDDKSICKARILWTKQG